MSPRVETTKLGPVTWRLHCSSLGTFRGCANVFKNYNVSWLFSICILWTSKSWSAHQKLHHPPSGCIPEPQRSLYMSPLQASESHGGSGVLCLVHCYIVCSWSKRRSPINIWCIFLLTKKKSRSVSFRNNGYIPPPVHQLQTPLQLPVHHWPNSVELVSELLRKYKKFSPHLDFLFDNCLNYDFCGITTLGILWIPISTLPLCAYAHMSW